MSNLFHTKELTDEDFLFFKEKIFAKSGIHLNIGKKVLVQSRLNAHLDELGLKSFREYREHLENLPPQDPEHQVFVNFLTTNKTDWFREIEHFSYLQDFFIPAFLKLGKKNLKVWSAASSTGEEAYTIAVVLSHLLEKSGIQFEIIGSDIDTKVLEHARNGVYPKDQLESIPTEYHAYFDLGKGEIKDWMKVGKKIKTHVRFEQFNLKSQDYKKLTSDFDLIFCRNVMIYFTPEMITEVAKKCFDNSSKEAVMIISHSESMQGLKIPWKLSRPSVYVKGQHFSSRA
jgi:chemotaxis protein methyltransferase CheR